LGTRDAGDSDRFTTAASSVRTEGAELDRVLASVAARLEEKHGRLGEDAARLMALGDEASDRLGRVAHYLSKEGAKLDARSDALEKAAERVQQQVEVLLSDLPKAEERARQVAEVIKEAGLGAHAQAGALEAQLSGLVARGREADEVVGGAAQRLGAHLDRVETTTEAATARMQDAADAMAATVDGSMARAAEAVDAARAGLEAQGSAMLAMIDQSRAALDRAGDEATRGLGERLDAITGRIEAVAAHLAAQDEASRALVGGLAQELGQLEQRLGSLQGSESVDAVRASVRQLGEELAASSESTAALVERAQSISGLMAGMGAQLVGEVPDALDRVEQHAERARLTVAGLAPEVESMAGSAESAAQRLREAELTLGNQQQALDAMLARLGEGVSGAEQQIRALASATAEANEAAGQITATTGPELVDALLRVREAATQAAERAREAIAAVIPESAAALGDASRRAVTEAVGGAVTQQLVELETLAERSVEAARRASERLTRQMLTIGETTAAVEDRIDQTRKEREAKENENFSRRVALLIESLNSTAIDVTKILSNEVTDSAWAAYLKGDRGVFTRRAVRLIDAGEAREIMAHYEAEPEFREQVNRYIHDFEAMLRRVLADRDSSALGVTLLGSDMGKLYVALAQAIERIRA
jgi:ABC-type transporter Mla subunit MlaD